MNARRSEKGTVPFFSLRKKKGDCPHFCLLGEKVEMLNELGDGQLLGPDVSFQGEFFISLVYEGQREIELLQVIYKNFSSVLKSSP